MSMLPLPPGTLRVVRSARKGELLFFRHPSPQRVWALGRVQEVFPGELRQLGEVILQSEDGDGLHRVKLEHTHPCHESHLENSPDVALMNDMHEAPLLLLLERRFQAGYIYTFSGEILISVNPYQYIPALYTLPAQGATAAAGGGPALPTAAAPSGPVRADPHVFTVAERAHWALQQSHDSPEGPRNQALIVSGESGAGKTESCKYVMQYLAHLSEGAIAAAATATAGTASIEQRVLNCNPFLEAFGNAKTLRNDNSSRFGKFLRIEYQAGRISGARMTHYLLEKARVSRPNPGERNYHIFYQLLRGASEEERRELLLGEVRDYAYLVSGGEASTVIEGVNDALELGLTRGALDRVGITRADQEDIWRVLAAVLHLGNATFGPTPEAPEEARIVEPFSAAHAGKLLGCGSRLSAKLVKRVMRVKGRGSQYEVALTERQAAVARDSLAKAIYERLFSWLIRRTNAVLGSPGAAGGGAPPPAFIGILDIFGFEIFEEHKNSFEQLCINYANEKLQALFNHHIFVMEAELYKAQGVDVSAVQWSSNATCVELLEARNYGLLPALDDVNYLAREGTTDADYLDKIDKMHRGRHPHYEDSRRPTPGTFSVKHFAGRVMYSVEGFLEKNNDTLYGDLEDLMRTSEAPFVRELFVGPGGGEEEGGASSVSSSSTRAAGVAAGGGATPFSATGSSSSSSGSGSGGTSTLASKFKSQLQQLYDTLLTVKPHYVRCLKPNSSKRPLYLDRGMVLTQMLYAGVLETIRIRQQGFPLREGYGVFWRRAQRAGLQGLLAPGRAALYPPLPPPRPLPDGRGGMKDFSLTPFLLDQCKAATCELLRGALPPIAPPTPATTATAAPAAAVPQWAAGHTLVFLKSGALEALERGVRAAKSVVIGAWWRGRWRARCFARLRAALVRLQRAFLFRRLKRRFAAAEGPLARLQARWRGRRARAAFTAHLARRAAAGAKVRATLLAWRTARAYAATRAAAVRLQAFARAARARAVAAGRWDARATVQAFMLMAHARRAYLGRCAMREGAARAICAAWRGTRQRVLFLTGRRAVLALQRRLRCGGAQRELGARRRAGEVLRRWGRCCARRADLRMLRRVVRRLQAWWRGWQGRGIAGQRRRAAMRVKAFFCAAWRGRALRGWVGDVFAAAAWGDVAYLWQVLHCAQPQYAPLRHTHQSSGIPLFRRVNIRNRRDGFKSLLHAAVDSGEVGAVELLLGVGGCDRLPRDRARATPLHRAAAAGDSHLPILQVLYAAQALKGGVGFGTLAQSRACAMLNAGGESVLGAAANAAAAAAASAAAAAAGAGAGGGGGAGEPTHAATLAFLLGCPGVPATGSRLPHAMLVALSQQQGATAAATAGAGATAGATAGSAGCGGAEAADPHYAFFLLQAQVQAQVEERRQLRRQHAVLAAGAGREAAAATAAAAAAGAAAEVKEAKLRADREAVESARRKRSQATPLFSPASSRRAAAAGGGGGGGGGPSATPGRKRPPATSISAIASLVKNLGGPVLPLPASPSEGDDAEREVQPGSARAIVLLSSHSARSRGEAQRSLLQLLEANRINFTTYYVDEEEEEEQQQQQQQAIVARALALSPQPSLFPQLFAFVPPPAAEVTTGAAASTPQAAHSSSGKLQYVGTWEDLSAAHLSGRGEEALAPFTRRAAVATASAEGGRGGGGSEVSPPPSSSGSSSPRASLSPRAPLQGGVVGSGRPMPPPLRVAPLSPLSPRGGGAVGGGGAGLSPSSSSSSSSSSSFTMRPLAASPTAATAAPTSATTSPPPPRGSKLPRPPPPPSTSLAAGSKLPPGGATLATSPAAAATAAASGGRPTRLLPLALTGTGGATASSGGGAPSPGPKSPTGTGRSSLKTTGPLSVKLGERVMALVAKEERGRRAEALQASSWSAHLQSTRAAVDRLASRSSRLRSEPPAAAAAAAAAAALPPRKLDAPTGKATWGAAAGGGGGMQQQLQPLPQPPLPLPPAPLHATPPAPPASSATSSGREPSAAVVAMLMASAERAHGRALEAEREVLAAERAAGERAQAAQAGAARASAQLRQLWEKAPGGGRTLLHTLGLNPPPPPAPDAFFRLSPQTASQSSEEGTPLSSPGVHFSPMPRDEPPSPAPGATTTGLGVGFSHATTTPAPPAHRLAALSPEGAAPLPAAAAATTGSGGGLFPAPLQGLPMPSTAGLRPRWEVRHSLSTGMPFFYDVLSVRVLFCSFFPLFMPQPLPLPPLPPPFFLSFTCLFLALLARAAPLTHLRPLNPPPPPRPSFSLPLLLNLRASPSGSSLKSSGRWSPTLPLRVPPLPQLEAAVHPKQGLRPPPC
jgi:hypothetical protein